MLTAEALSDSELSDLEITARNYLTGCLLDESGLDSRDPVIQEWLLEQTVELGFRLRQTLRAYVDFDLELPPDRS